MYQVYKEKMTMNLDGEEEKSIIFEPCITEPNSKGDELPPEEEYLELVTSAV